MRTNNNDRATFSADEDNYIRRAARIIISTGTQGGLTYSTAVGIRVVRPSCTSSDLHQNDAAISVMCIKDGRRYRLGLQFPVVISHFAFLRFTCCVVA